MVKCHISAAVDSMKIGIQMEFNMRNSTMQLLLVYYLYCCHGMTPCMYSVSSQECIFIRIHLNLCMTVYLHDFSPLVRNFIAHTNRNLPNLAQYASQSMSIDQPRLGTTAAWFLHELNAKFTLSQPHTSFASLLMREWPFCVLSYCFAVLCRQQQIPACLNLLLMICRCCVPDEPLGVFHAVLPPLAPFSESPFA